MTDHAEINDLIYAGAKHVVWQRTRYTDLKENLDALASGVLWRLMQITDPDDFQRIVDEAVEFVTPSPDL